MLLIIPIVDMINNRFENKDNFYYVNIKGFIDH
jgi:hypothetical protein